jgi:hypothetical protein
MAGCGPGTPTSPRAQGTWPWSLFLPVVFGLIAPLNALRTLNRRKFEKTIPLFFFAKEFTVKETIRNYALPQLKTECGEKET